MGAEHYLEEAKTANMEALRVNEYPGRGIIIGLNSAGELAVQVYWIMGRSEGSRNRLLVQEEDIVKTVPFDETKIERPELTIYNAMRQIHGHHIVSNGHQTDSIVEAFENGQRLDEALQKWSFEDDGPIYTPRISGLYSPREIFSSVTFSLIRREEGNEANPMNPLRTSKTYNINQLQGTGYCIHTYEENGNPPPSFQRQPYPVKLGETLGEIAETYWDLLDKENKVALVVKGIDRKTGETSYEIVNALAV